MTNDANLQEFLKQLYARRRFGVKPGLERIHCLLDRLSHPQSSFPAIHVAGTNGKGSVCTMIQHLLTAAGLKTARFSSPHLVHFNERFTLDDQPVTDDDLRGGLTDVLAADAALPEPGVSTFFEICTALAFVLFRRMQVDAAVVETGLGGRLDATNVLQPLVSVLTRVAMDHEAYLGRTLAAIAAEKAGIIKRGVPVVLGCNHEDVHTVVRQVAGRCGAPVIAVEEACQVVLKRRQRGDAHLEIQTAAATYSGFSMPIQGPFQLENLMIAIPAAELALERLGLEPLCETHVRTALAGLQVPGRLQQIGAHPPVWVDGAHNPSAADALAQALNVMCTNEMPVFLVIGMSEDKDHQGFLHALKHRAQQVWFTASSSERSVDPSRLLAIGRQEGLNAQCADSLHDALAQAKAAAIDQNGLVVVTGSLFLVGNVLAQGRICDGNE